MATPEILDFDKLLAPISTEEPAGIELKEDAALSADYYQVKDAREAARTAERQLVQAALDEGESGSTEPPNWQVVIDLASEAIAEKSKDLWIAAWLIEALVRRHGFAGLRDGFRLAGELAERFWDGIHPRPDEDGVATTVAQFTGLNGDDSEGALIAPIDAVPITAAGVIDPLTGSDYKQAGNVQQITDPEVRERRIQQGAVTLDLFDKAVTQTPPEFFQNLMDDINQSIEQFGRLCDVLEEKCGKDDDGYPTAPPSSAIRNALEQSRDRLRGLTREVFEADEGLVAEDETGQLVPVDGQGGTAAPSSQLQTRDEAFRALLQVADFFRRTEPHSIVSYSLEQVVRWGRMSLPELMTELIGDDSIRQEMFRRTGITPPDDSD